MRRSILAAAIAAVMLSACTDGNVGMKEGAGTVLGGIGGGFAGAQFGKGTGQLVGVAGGTLLGAFLGNQIGKSLDKADQLHAQRATDRAADAPVGQQIAWSNPKTGNHGTVAPVREGHRSDGAYCREFQSTISVGGKSEKAFGTACRQPDGSWQMVR